MTDIKTMTHAKVTLTIEISGIGLWGPECQLEQVYKQGTQSALGAINRLFCGDTQSGVRFRIVGPYKVEVITVEIER
jgi:hypothetical protein